MLDQFRLAFDHSKSAYATCFDIKGYWLPLIATPTLVVVMGSWLEANIFDLLFGDPDQIFPLIGGLLIAPVILLATHRLVLLNDPSFLVIPSELYRRRTINFLLLFIKIMAVVIAIIISIILIVLLPHSIFNLIPIEESQSIGSYLPYPVVFIITYFFMRFGIAFPMCALDQPTGLALSWKKTRGRGVFLWTLGILVGLPIMVLSLAIKWIPVDLPANEALSVILFNEALNVLLFIVGIAVEPLSSVVGAVALSLAFRTISAEKEL